MQTLKQENTLFIHALFERQAHLRPDAPAVIAQGVTLSYREVNQRANQLARALIARGVGPDVPVGIVVERSLEMVPGLLAIVKAGGAYIPLDPTHPAQRLASMLMDASAPIVLTQRKWLPKLAACSLPTICLDDSENAEEGDHPTPALFGDNLAYVIYTSGSTGQPKGVAISHANLSNYVQWHLARYKTGPQDRISQVFSFSFDAFVLELWPTLAAGACLYLPDEETRLSAVQLRDWLLQEHITIACAPTALAEALLALPWPAQAALRLLLIGGEQLHRYPSPELPFALVNHYGPTEGTVVTTAGTVPPTPECTSPPSIGEGIANVSLLIVDAHGYPVPPGQAGELCVSGANLARGYLAHPEWTAERFRPHPSGEPGARLYHTGDRVRLREDGTLEFLGRIDRQVKVRGYRIEPDEIEMALLHHPAVENAAVCLQEISPGNPQLVAYLVADQARLSTRKDVYQFLQHILPAYMLPTRWVFLEKMPLTINQKIDRNALPALYVSSHWHEDETPALLTLTEQQLARLWVRFLGEQAVARDANFFESGGHSLLITQMIFAIRDVFRVHLSISDFFEHPTLAELAQLIEVQGPQPQIPPLPRAARQNNFPLSYTQRQFWLLQQWDIDTPVCNETTVFLLQGPLNVEILQQSIDILVQRHAALRTTFPLLDNVPLQSIAPAQPILIEHRNVTTAAEREQLIQAEGRWPFALASGPLLRITLMKMDENTHVITLTMHHSISDGRSFSIFLRELTMSYRALLAGRQPELPALPLSYSDFSEWQHASLQGAILDELVGWWKHQLHGAPPVIALPGDHPRPAVQTFHGAQFSLDLPQALVQQLHAFRSKKNVTLFMTLFTAWATLLHRCSDQDDLVIGTALASRTHSEIEGVIGAFVNALPLRVRFSRGLTFHDLLRQVRSVTSDTYTHQALPFEKLVDELHIARTQQHFPLFQTLFVLQNDLAADLQLPGVTVEAVPYNNGTSMFDLTLEVIETASGLNTRFQYSTDLFSAPTIERMAKRFQLVLRQMVQSPEQVVTAFPLLLPEERHLLYSHLQGTSSAVTQQHATVHELLHQQALKRPEALAVVHLEQKLTYGELAQRTNQLARYLQALGVGPEVCVGICVERSIDMIIGLIGILKSGGAYVPLDPTHPAERLARIVADTHLPLVLTQEHLAQHLSACQTRCILLDRAWEAIAQESQEALSTHIQLDTLAYVIYTSGSTGQPKGVAISHANLSNYVQWHLARYKPGPQDRVSQVFNFSFDAFVQELWPTLAAGACLCLPNEETRLSAVQLRDWLLQEHITIACAPTALAEALLALTWPAQAALRLLLIGGEQLHRYPSPELPFVLVNHYGPTEGTVVTTAITVPPTPECTFPPSIGERIANVSLLIVDAYGHPVPPGQAGELCVSGANLARGYLAHPEWTAERFRPLPSGEPGARLYHTGDRVRLREDGTLEFLGRIDRQVKVRGYRIELGEIEMALLRHPAIREALVTKESSTATSDRLIAYIVPAAEAEEGLVTELRHHIQRLLPASMQPAGFILLPALPLTPNGKIDYASLPVPDARNVALETAYAPARTAVERRLLELLSPLLGQASMGIDDDFFDRGGNSLLAARYCTDIRACFQIDLPLRAIFEASTVATLAVKVEDVLQQRKHPGDEVDAQQLLASFSSLSEEEVERLLLHFADKEGLSFDD